LTVMRTFFTGALPAGGSSLPCSMVAWIMFSGQTGCMSLSAAASCGLGFCIAAGSSAGYCTESTMALTFSNLASGGMAQPMAMM